MNRPDLMKRAREFMDEKQRETADALGFELSTYDRKENGRTPVRDCDLIAVAARVNGIMTVEDAARVIDTATTRRRK